MNNDRSWAVFCAFALACSSAGGGASANGGSAANGGASGSPASAGTGGATGGSSTTNGGSSAGTPMIGGGGAGPSSGGRGNSGEGGAGRGGGGASSGGVAPNAGSGGGGTAGAAGTASCVKNLACKLQAPASSGDILQDCVDRINQFRTQCACLPPLQRNTDGEACANQMAEYDAGKDTAHAGYTDKICQPSGAQNECPGYSSQNQVISLCLQQMWDEGPPPTNPCDGACFQTYGHFINMTSTSTTKVACGSFTTADGKVWAVQNFTR